jgi:hypothetical protein
VIESATHLHVTKRTRPLTELAAEYTYYTKSVPKRDEPSKEEAAGRHHPPEPYRSPPARSHMPRGLRQNELLTTAEQYDVSTTWVRHDGGRSKDAKWEEKQVRVGAGSVR